MIWNEIEYLIYLFIYLFIQILTCSFESHSSKFGKFDEVKNWRWN